MKEEYRDRYGLPWRRGLVSARVLRRLSQMVTERIRGGSFKPNPDNRAAVARIRAGGMRRDQPFLTAVKSKLGAEQSKRNLRYDPRDFEKVLKEMLKRKATLRETCMDKSLPSEPTVLRYAELNPSFRKKFLDTYHALPYPVQARGDMLSPRFFNDLKRLKKKGLSSDEIAGKLGVSAKTVVRKLKQMQ